MPVRITEQRIPKGFTAQDLGDDYHVSLDGKVVLISYLPSPIRVGQLSTYVAFVVEEEAAKKATHFEWTVYQSGGDELVEKKTVSTDSSVFEYTFEETGEYLVMLKILDENKELLDPDEGHWTYLYQTVQKKIPHLEGMIETSSESIQEENAQVFKGALAGHPDATRELHYDLMPIINAITKTNVSDNLLPVEFLVSALYLNILKHPKTRDVFLWGLKSHRNEVENKIADHYYQKKITGNTFRLPIGLAQLRPIEAATVIKNEDNGNQPYLPWADLPLSKYKVHQGIAEQTKLYRELSWLEKADIFNLLRFPKSSIQLLYQYLCKIKNRETTGSHARFPQLSRDAILDKDNRYAGEIIGTEWDLSPRDAKYARAEPQEGELSANARGRKVMQLLHAPFLSDVVKGPSVFRGEVMDENRQPVAGVRVDRYEISGLKVRTTGLKFRKDRENYGNAQEGEESLVAGSVYELLDTWPLEKSEEKTTNAFYAKIKGTFGGVEKEGWVQTHAGNNVYAVQTFASQINAATTNAQGEFQIPIPENGRWQMLRFVKKGFWDQEIDWTNEPDIDLEIKMDKPSEASTRWLKETDIIKLLDHYTGFEYDSGANFPFEIQSYLNNSNGVVNNVEETGCNGFQLGLITKAWQLEFGNNTIDIKEDDYKTLMIYATTLNQSNRLNAFSPFLNWKIGEIIHKRESVAGANINLTQEPLPWCLIQGFRYKHDNNIDKTHSGVTAEAWKHGHMFLFMDYHPNTKRVLRFESSTVSVPYAEGQNDKDGPQFKKLGHINYYKNADPKYSPGYDWWKIKKLDKWGDVAPNTAEQSGSPPRYPYRALVRLYVYDLKITRPIEK